MGLGEEGESKSIERQTNTMLVLVFSWAILTIRKIQNNNSHSLSYTFNLTFPRLLYIIVYLGFEKQVLQQSSCVYKIWIWYWELLLQISVDNCK